MGFYGLVWIFLVIQFLSTSITGASEVKVSFEVVCNVVAGLIVFQSSKSNTNDLWNLFDSITHLFLLKVIHPRIRVTVTPSETGERRT